MRMRKCYCQSFYNKNYIGGRQHIVQKWRESKKKCRLLNNISPKTEKIYNLHLRSPVNNETLT